MPIGTTLRRWLRPPPRPLGASDLLASLLVMAWLVEARDPYTGGHLWRVSRYAELLGEAAGLPDAEVARVAISGFLHDLGKIGIPDGILNYAGPLDDEAMDTMRTHPEIGERLLAGHPLSALVRDVVLHHHERPDGTGYPGGLAGDAITRDAKLVAICDAFDAMTSARPYRAPMPIKAALARIDAALGSQFDDGLGNTFLRLRESGMLEMIVGHSDDGIPMQTCNMCGPTLTLQADSRDGACVYCRACGGEYRIRTSASGQRSVAPTGRMGTAQQREPAPDTALISRLIRDAEARASLHDMLRALPMARAA